MPKFRCPIGTKFQMISCLLIISFCFTDDDVHFVFQSQQPEYNRLFCVMKLCLTQNSLPTFSCLLLLHTVTTFSLVSSPSLPPSPACPSSSSSTVHLFPPSLSPPLSAALVSDFVLLCVSNTPSPSPSLSVRSHRDEGRWAPLTVLLIKT